MHFRNIAWNKVDQAQQLRSPAVDAKCHGAPKRAGHRDVDAGQGTLLLGKVLLVACLMESANQGTGAEGDRGEQGDSRVPDCPLNHISSYITTAVWYLVS